MVLVIEGKDRARHADLFEKLFRARYETFVVNRRWSLPARNGLEIDQYDTDQAVYFIDVDETGHLQGSLRLTPTVTASLTADYYPHLSDGAVPLRDPLVYEGTRYMTSPRELNARNSRAAKARIMCAATEWACELGIRQVQAVLDAPLFPVFKKINTETVALGAAHPYGGGKGVAGGGICMALRMPMTEKAIREVKDYGGLETSMLPEPFVDGPVQPPLQNVA